MDVHEQELHTYSSDANFLAGSVRSLEIIVDSIERVDRVVDSSKVKGDVEVLSTGNEPPLVLLVVVGTLNASIDCVGHITRYLGKREPKFKFRRVPKVIDICCTHPLSMTATNWLEGACGTMDLTLMGCPSGPMMPLSSSVRACQCWSTEVNQ